MTWPLEREPVTYHNHIPEGFLHTKLTRFIDVGWMRKKKLKWIGWDDEGWIAWSSPDGMLYRLRDLKRTEDGEQYEKEVGEELKIEGDGDEKPVYQSVKQFYTHEMNVQKECGYCPKDRAAGVSDETTPPPAGGSTPEEDEEEEDDETMPDWKKYAMAAATGTLAEGGKRAGSTGSASGAAAGGGANNMPPVPILPLTPMPTGNANAYTPRPTNPATVKIANDASIVTMPAPNPIDALYAKPPVKPLKQDSLPKPASQTPPSQTTNSKGLSEAGRALLKDYEVFKANMYNDAANNATIGYGVLIHKGKVGTNDAKEKPYKDGITEEQANQMLTEKLKAFEKDVDKGVKVPLSQNQRDALILFHYNTGGLLTSTLLKKINAGADGKEIEKEFKKWDKITQNGKKVPSPGLTKRRQDEADLYNFGDYKRN